MKWFLTKDQQAMNASMTGFRSALVNYGFCRGAGKPFYELLLLSKASLTLSGLTIHLLHFRTVNHYYKNNVNILWNDLEQKVYTHVQYHNANWPATENAFLRVAQLVLAHSISELWKLATNCISRIS